jgi:hypothetical protein
VTFRGLVFDSCDNGCIAFVSGNMCAVVVDNCVFQNRHHRSGLSAERGRDAEDCFRERRCS